MWSTSCAALLRFSSNFLLSCEGELFFTLKNGMFVVVEAEADDPLVTAVPEIALVLADGVG